MGKQRGVKQLMARTTACGNARPRAACSWLLALLLNRPGNASPGSLLPLPPPAGLVSKAAFMHYVRTGARPGQPASKRRADTLYRVGGQQR